MPATSIELTLDAAASLSSVFESTFMYCTAEVCFLMAEDKLSKGEVALEQHHTKAFEK